MNEFMRCSFHDTYHFFQFLYFLSVSAFFYQVFLHFHSEADLEGTSIIGVAADLVYSRSSVQL